MRLLLALECENFPEQRRALRAPGLPRGERLGSPVVPPRALREAAGGALLLVDWDQGAVIGRLDLPTPSGLCWPEPEGPLWAACQGPADLRALDPGSGAELQRWTHPAFCDLHRLVARPGGGLMVASSGTDSVVALDAEGQEAWRYLGDPTLDLGRSHADDETPTLARQVHPTSLAALSPDEALMCSFHLGAILRIGRKIHPQVVFDGLRQPHGLTRGPEGWFVADTGRGRILHLDAGLRVARVLAEGFRWLQDLAARPDGGLWVVENKDFRGAEGPGGPRLLELGPDGRERARLELSPDWRLGCVLPLDEARAERLGWPLVRVRARHRRAPPGGTAGG